MAYTLDELYGTSVNKTGVFYNALWNVVHGPASKKAGRKLLVLRGEMHHTVCENMNTLLDDNKKITFAWGETIHLPDDVTIVFETSSCREASPANVSRVGAVYLSTQRDHPKNILFAKS
jgi:dynein heavy chain